MIRPSKKLIIKAGFLFILFLIGFITSFYFFENLSAFFEPPAPKISGFKPPFKSEYENPFDENIFPLPETEDKIASDSTRMSRAAQELGCDSSSLCKTFCDQKQNFEKCDKFAKSASMRGGIKIIGPGDCDSENSCGKFCSNLNNFSVCKEFAQSINQDFVGPGECNSPDSCKDYCQKHKDICESFFTLSTGRQTREGTLIGFERFIKSVNNLASQFKWFIPRPQ